MGGGGWAQMIDGLGSHCPAIRTRLRTVVRLGLQLGEEEQNGL